MKIPGSGNLYGAAGAAQSYQTRGTHSAGQRERAARRFDTISIGSAGVGRSSYEMELKSRLTQEVRAGATPGRLSSLSQQIEDGTYEPDALSIARRMMRMVEEA